MPVSNKHDKIVLRMRYVFTVFLNHNCTELQAKTDIIFLYFVRNGRSYHYPSVYHYFLNIVFLVYNDVLLKIFRLYLLKSQYIDFVNKFRYTITCKEHKVDHFCKKKMYKLS